MKTIPFPKVLGGILIVGGTAIGAGMLALPVVTGFGGFLPATFVYFLCWIFSAATGLLFLEICLWMPQDANIISMAYRILGPIGKAFAWILYIFLFYSLTVAYIGGGGGFVSLLFGGIPPWLGVTLFTLVFGLFVYIGTSAVDRMNRILMIGLIVSFLFFIAFGSSKINFSYLTRMHWGASFLALPVIFTSFSYQGVIPSLNTYLNRNPKLMRIAIIAGSSLPFISYVIWELLILGIVPAVGPHGLMEAKLEGRTAIEPLKHFLTSSPVYAISQFFGFFALTTSFLGVTMGLLDFLSDALQMAKVGLKKVFLCSIIFIPPALIAITYPGIFLKALGYAGGIGCALLLGFFPILMVWVGRYIKKYPKLDCQLPGGKPILLLMFSFVAFELIIELIEELFSH